MEPDRWLRQLVTQTVPGRSGPQVQCMCCGLRTAGRKPYCPQHTERNPYASRVVRRLAARSLDRARGEVPDYLASELVGLLLDGPRNTGNLRSSAGWPLGMVLEVMWSLQDHGAVWSESTGRSRVWGLIRSSDAGPP